MKTETIQFNGYNGHEVADWIKDRGGSCTSPLAVDYNCEEFRVATPMGGEVIGLGNWVSYDGTRFYVAVAR